MGAEELGGYAFYFSVATVLTMISQMGFPLLVIRLMSIYSSSRDWSLAIGLIACSYKITLAVSLVLTATATLIFFYFYEHHANADWRSFSFAMLLVPLYALININTASLRGLGARLRSVSMDVFLRPAVLCVLISVPFLSGQTSYSSDHVMGLTAAAAVLVLLIGVLHLHTLFPASTRRLPVQTCRREWIHSALPLLTVAGMQSVISQTDILMLGFMTDRTNVGVYRIVNQSAGLCLFVLGVTSSLLSANLARLLDERNTSDAESILRKTVSLNCVLTLPLVVFYLLAGELYLSVIFGEAFIIGYTALAILAIAQFITIMLGPSNMILAMGGFGKEASIGVGSGALTNILLNYFLIPPFGINGAAISTGISIVVWHTLLSYIVFKKTGIKPYLSIRGNR